MDFGKQGMGTTQKVLLIGGGVILLICVIVAGFFYTQYQSLKKNPNSQAEAESKKLVDQIRPFYDLPTDENPTIATVSDKSKVVDQPFFAKAENGDKILIYRKNKLAILFRPSKKQLINVGPIDLDAAAGASGETSEAASSAATVGLYNSGTAAGLTTTAEAKLKAAAYASTMSIAEKKTATTKTTGRIVVVDVSGSNKDLAGKIAATLGGTVGTLPAGEAKPGVEVAVYVGK